MTAPLFTWRGKKSKGLWLCLPLDNYIRSISTCTDRHTLINPPTHTESFTAYDWLRPYTSFLPLITIKIVTLVFMQHKHTRAENGSLVYCGCDDKRASNKRGPMSSLTCAGRDKSSSLSLATISAINPLLGFIHTADLHLQPQWHETQTHGFFNELSSSDSGYQSNKWPLPF